MKRRSILIGCLWAVGAAACAEVLPLSKVMAALSENEAAREEFFRRLGVNSTAGGILGPDEIKLLRRLVAGKDWEKVDRFPGISVAGLGRTVRLAAMASGKKEAAPGRAGPGAAGIEDLGLPRTTPVMNRAEMVKELGFGLLWGEDPHPELGQWHANSARLADLLTRLARGGGRFRVRAGSGEVSTAEGLIQALVREGSSVEVLDSRYFANFGDLRYNGEDVLTGFWMDTGIPLPGANRTLLVPVGHSQHEIWVKGKVTAVVSFFFGIDGKAEFRSMDTRDQSWVMGRVAHRYQGAQATEAVRSAAAVIRAYDAIHAKNPDLAYGGYFTLGVCNDVNAMVEQHLQGKTTLFPLTSEAKYFAGLGEVEEWAKAIPHDGGRRSPELQRVMGSIPVDRLEDLPFPGLQEDLVKVQQGGGATGLSLRGAIVAGLALIAVLAWLGYRQRRALLGTEPRP